MNTEIIIEMPKPLLYVIESHTVTDVYEEPPMTKLTLKICKLIGVTPVRKWTYRYKVKTNPTLIPHASYIDELHQMWYSYTEGEIISITPIHETIMTRNLTRLSSMTNEI